MHCNGSYVPGGIHKSHLFFLSLCTPVSAIRRLVVHIDARCTDPFYGVQGKFLKIFEANHECTRIDTNAREQRAADSSDAEFPELTTNPAPAGRLDTNAGAQRTTDHTDSTDLGSGRRGDLVNNFSITQRTKIFGIRNAGRQTRRGEKGFPAQKIKLRRRSSDQTRSRLGP